MIERYENLRQAALYGGGSALTSGLGFFLEQGMARWVRTWAALPEPARGLSVGALGFGESKSAAGPSEKELALVVAEIVLKQLREVPCRTSMAR